METPAAPVEDHLLEMKDWSPHHTPAARYTTLNTAAGMVIVKEAVKRFTLVDLVDFCTFASICS